MTLKVIGAGLGRTATFSLKFALEHLGLGPCYHMAEVRADARRNMPLWLNVVRGKPDWNAVFAGFQSTTDYPACTYWRELAAFYPHAKVVLSVRDANSWFDSVSETIFSPKMQALLAGSPFEAIMKGAIYDAFGDRLGDRTFMTEWFTRRNQSVIDALPPERLLVFSPKQGWEPLCAFLDVPVPNVPFPRVNSRDELTQFLDEAHELPPDPETAEKSARAHIDALKAKAFAR
jgi:hypothetical protein